ncbi:MAG: O-methyltransferase [Vicinamibacterales bacterium]
MSQLNYQIRPNKAVDRLAFMDVLRRLDRRERLADYTYHSLGGPYLEDFRSLYDVDENIRMVSIETDAEVIKRQKFHLPCRHLRLRRTDLHSFIAQYQSRDRKSIFWLDYMRLAYADLADFEALLSKVAVNSVVKITLRSRSADYLRPEQVESFKQEFAALLPDPNAAPPSSKEGFARLVQTMVRVAAQRAFPGTNPFAYQPLCSFFYADATPMLTVTGIVCRRVDRAEIRDHFADWPFASLHWASPKRIAVPVLTTKERLYLQDFLPARQSSGRTLRRALGYRIDEDPTESNEMFKQYATFHRYSPYYMRGIP